MARLRKKLERKAGFFAFSRLEKAFLKKDPLRAEAAGAKLGLLVYKLSKKHRETALFNLNLAFPEMSEEERIALAKRCFQHFGRVFADFLRSSQRTEEEVRATTAFHGGEILDEALSNGKGVILVSGHLGN